MSGEVDTKKDEKYAPRTFMKYSSADLGRDTPGELVLMSCNEAIARAAIEAGVRVITSYPGSPVNYVLDSLAGAKHLYPSMHIEWSTNERNAFEVVVGATRGNLRGMAVFKNVGMNLITDPLMASVHLGVSGAVIVFNDDPNAETTGNTQDSRFIPRYALCPILEPATMQEVKDWIVEAYDLSIELRMPVFVRVRDRTGWGQEPVTLGKIQHSVRETKAHCDADDINQFRYGYGIPLPEQEKALRVAPYPLWFSTSLRLHNEASEDVIREVGQLPNLQARDQAVESYPRHKLTLREGAKVGIITAGCYELVPETLDVMGLANEVSVLRLATSYPLPKLLVKEILEATEVILVVEEIEPLIEEQVRSIAAEMDKHAKIVGKLTHHIPTLFEVERNVIGRALAQVMEREFEPEGLQARIEEGKRILQDELKFGDPTELSKMCPGCPEYAGLYALKRTAEEMGVEIIGYGGDGCFDLVMQPPLRVEKTALPLGGSVGGAHGLATSGVDQKVVALMGDGGFFHNGMLNVINAVYNKSDIMIVFLDNRSVGQTGHQPHPGAFGITAAGEPTKTLDMVDILKAFQLDFVEVVDPFDQKQCRVVFEKALRMSGVRAVVVRRTCSQIAVRLTGQTIRGVRVLGPQSQVDTERCLAAIVEKAPCEAACPAGIDVEGYIRAIAERDFRKSLRIIREKNPFAGVCGYICDHPCEQDCKRVKVDQAIDIRGLKRFAAEFEFKNGMETPGPIKHTKEEKVAIIGSGPAGMTAAYDLVKEGYEVNVFEALPVAGGTLSNAIPEFILPKKVVERDIDYIKSLGVEIKTGVTLGKDMSLNDLFEQGYKAIFVAIGAWSGLTLKIPGTDLEGVYTALPLLQDIKQGKDRTLSGNVMIIGGGNIAMDMARTAVRLGAQEVHVACLESRQNIPAFEWEIQRAIEEGVIVHPSLSPQEIKSDNGKRISAVRFTRVSSTALDSDGKINWTLMEGPGGEIVMDADIVIFAVGQAPDPSALLGDGELEITQHGTLKADEITLATNVPGVFAGGDAVSGPATAIQAVAAGHKAGESIDRYLRGVDLREGRVEERAPITGADRLPTDIRSRSRVVMPIVPPQRRARNFGEVELGFTEEMAISEAKRCLHCKTCGMCINEFGCVSLTVQENEALGKEYPQVELNTCAGCGVCNQVCPYSSIITLEG